MTALSDLRKAAEDLCILTRDRRCLSCGHEWRQLDVEPVIETSAQIRGEERPYTKVHGPEACPKCKHR